MENGNKHSHLSYLESHKVVSDALAGLLLSAGAGGGAGEGVLRPTGRRAGGVEEAGAREGGVGRIKPGEQPARHHNKHNSLGLAVLQCGGACSGRCGRRRRAGTRWRSPHRRRHRRRCSGPGGSAGPAARSPGPAPALPQTPRAVCSYKVA